MTELTNIETLQALVDGKRVEYQEPDGNWRELDKHFRIDTLLKADMKFRLRVEMTSVADVSFPKPERSCLIPGATYYVANPAYKELATYWTWSDDEHDERYLSRGIVHLTQENAVAHAKALIKLSGGVV